jgi:hypothetical protein
MAVGMAGFFLEADRGEKESLGDPFAPLGGMAVHEL